jgi:hypothetical protein
METESECEIQIVLRRERDSEIERVMDTDIDGDSE